MRKLPTHLRAQMVLRASKGLADVWLLRYTVFTTGHGVLIAWKRYER